MENLLLARPRQLGPAGKHATVRIEVGGSSDEQPLPSAATVDLRWLHRGGTEAGMSDVLKDAVRDVAWPDPATRLFAWAGCEHRSFRAIRNHLRRDRALRRDEHLVAAYWRRGASGDDARKEG